MTEASMEMPSSSRLRWCLAIFLVLLFQVAAVVLLEKHSADAPPKKVAAPTIHLRENISLEAYAVSDPTVFVLPHHHGFSGAAWLNDLPSLKFQPADWNEPPRALPFTSEMTGVNFDGFIQANPARNFEAIATLTPAQSVPVLYTLETIPGESSVRLAGPLAERRLLTTLHLPVRESDDLITNSVVRLLVDSEGRTISAIMLAPGLRRKQQEEADASAVEMAKAARFEPSPAGTPTVGLMIFQWWTVPLPFTNAPPAIP